MDNMFKGIDLSGIVSCLNQIEFPNFKALDNYALRPNNGLIDRIAAIEENIIRLNAMIQAIIDVGFDEKTSIPLLEQYQKRISSLQMKAVSVNQSSSGGQ